MSKPIILDSQQGFAGGYNSAGLTGPIAENQFAAMTNVRVLPNGDMAKRPGMRLVSSFGGSSAWSLWAWNKASALPQVISQDTSNLTFQSGTLVASTGVIAWDSPIATPSFSYRTSGSAHFRDSTNERLYLSPNGSNKIAKWSATVLTEGLGTPTGIRQLWVYNQRLFGCTQTDQVLWYSALNDGDTLGTTASGGGFATIRTFGGNNIIGGFALGQSNFILHDNAISIFTGRTYDDIQISAGAGGFANNIGYPLAWQVINSVAYLVTTTGLYFVTEQGVTAYRQPDRPDPIADLAKHGHAMRGNAMDSQPMTSIADNQRADEVWITVTISDASGVYTPYLFIYHKRLERFTGAGTFSTAPWTDVFTTGNYGWYALSAMYLGVHTSQLLLLAATAVFGCDFETASLDAFQDNSVSYTSSVRCRRFFGVSGTGVPVPRVTKAYRRADVLMGLGGLGTASVGSATGATASFTAADGTASTDTTALLAGETTRIQLGGQGQFGDLTITDSGSSSTGWSVSGVDLEAFDYGMRGR